ncbi:MAG: succinylglutamate desuccinylase/aspartoacylase family protein, partial [Chloroflexi bacterium]|nr:succinylglutamate desuccinylase/aspartoacylase family protein [Chloroflexota bacterium]
MASELKIGALSAGRGQKTSGIHSLKLQDRTTDLPVFLVNGQTDGPTLVVTGGVHGAEYASIEAALRLGRSLDPAKLHGRVIVVPVERLGEGRAVNQGAGSRQGRGGNGFGTDCHLARFFSALRFT